jgi:adenylate cyclase
MAFGFDTSQQNIWPGLLLGLLVAVVLLVPGHRWSDNLEAVTYDWRFRVRDPLLPGEEIVLVGIDSTDLEILGQWPWWRQDWGDLLLPFCEDPDIRPAAIVFDILFTEEEGMRTEGHIRELESRLHDLERHAPESDRALGEIRNTIELLTDLHDFARESDKYFSEVIESLGNVDLAAYFNFREFGPSPQRDLSVISETNRLPARSIHESIPEPASFDIPIPSLASANHGIGFVNVLKDDDGVIRRTWTFLRHDGYLYPSLFLVAVCHYLGVNISELEVQPGEFILIPCAPNPIEIPIDRQGVMTINFRGRGAFRSPPQAVSCRDLILALGRHSGDLPPDTGPNSLLDPTSLGDKILLFGMFVEGVQEDTGAVPGAENYPLVAYHANAIDNILRGDFLRPHPESSRLLETLLVAFFAFAVGTSVRYLSPLRGAAGSIILAVLYWAIGFQSFSLFRWNLPLFRPSLAILLAFSGNVLFYFLVERRVRQRTVRFLSSYLSPNVVKRLLDSGQELQFGGQRTNVTILFSDIRGFTSLSERIPPEEVVDLLNQYFGEMTEIIFQHEGTLDKFMGDAIMVFYGHPEKRADDPLRAIRTALAMQQRMRVLQARWTVEEKESIGIGIGISSGDVVVGNVGTSGKAEYTAIGGAVNLAFRIQALAQAGEVLISESTYQVAKDHVEVQPRPPVQVKGKEELVAIYEVTRLVSETEEKERPVSPAAAEP